MAIIIFTQNGKLTTKFIKRLGTHAANLLTTINEKDCIRDEILKTHSDLIDEKVITAVSPTHYNLDLTIGCHSIHLSYREFVDAHCDYAHFRMMIGAAIDYRKQVVYNAGNIVLVRYSTDTDSWITPYVNLSVARKHIKKNVRIQFDGTDMWDAQSEVAADLEIDTQIDHRNKDIEIRSMAIEIEYGEHIITE